MSRRYDYLELLRFVAGLSVIATHMFNLGIPWGTYPLSHGWVFVEFFFIVTGYFTMRHYRHTDSESHDEHMKLSIRYTIKKFARIFPYSTIVIITQYVLDSLCLLKGGFWQFLTGFRNMPFEIAYLSCATNHAPAAATVWYVSAMFLVFPLFCCLLQIRSRNWLKWISFIIPVLYYCFFGVSTIREYPHDLVRAFSCMLIGVFIYLNQSEIAAICERMRSKLALTVIEVGCFLLAFAVAYRNSFGGLNLCLPAFIVSLSILFSGYSYTSSVSSKLFRWLGKLSLPMFLWNWTIGTGVRVLCPNASDGFKMVLYWILSIAIPVLTLCVVESTRKFLRGRRVIAS